MNTAVSPKNIRTHSYKGITEYELIEKSPEEWNKAAAAQRRVIFYQLYGMDPTDDAESQQGINKYFYGGE